jgi:tetratricopeptide (TPR) repeat protein
MNIALIALLLLAPQDPAALSDKAQQLAQQQRFDEAEKLWRQAIAIAPDFFPALFNLGYMKSSQGKYAESAPLLEQAARVNSKDFNTRYLLGQALTNLNRREDALRAWRAALAIQPGNVRLMQIMIVEYEKGRYFQEAAALAKRAIDAKPDLPDSYFLAIHAYQNARDFKSGLELSRLAAQRFPDSARANFEYAFHLQLTGSAEQARIYLERAMSADPRYEEPFFFYGDLLISQGQDEQAIPYLRKAIQNRNDYVEARVALAKALMHQEKWQEAIGELSETVRLDPKHPEPHLLLSRIYFRLGDEQRAASEKDIALRLRRENPALLEALQSRPFPVAQKSVQ